MEEVIIQSPDDLPPKKPQKANSDLIWKVLAGVFLVTTIIFLIISIAKGGSNENSSNSTNKSGSSSSSNGSGEDAPVETGYKLKGFDISIGKLMGSVGFNYGSILTLKTNADGTYLIGEVKNGDNIRFAYRSLPDGAWKKTGLKSAAYDKTKEQLVECDMAIAKEELEAFAGIKDSKGNELVCSITEEPDDEDSEASSTNYTAAEALKDKLYKDAE